MKLENDSVDRYLAREFGSRSISGGSALLVTLVAGSWSLFQLSLPRLLILDSLWVRAIHLAFALALVFLSFPCIRSDRLIGLFKGRATFLYRTDKLVPIDVLLAVIGVAAALYIAVEFDGIAQRMGNPMTRDIVVGVILVVLLLEAARRALSPALPIIAGVFVLYTFVSEYMPDLIAFKNASLSKVVSKLTLTTEGVYGVPLDVSASVVFLFVLFGSMLEKAGGGKYFIDLAFSLLGRFRGGPAKAAVLASGLTGMVNGSSIANTVTTGTFTIPLMKKMGFPAVKAGAIEVAASTNGQLMPPIMGAAAFIIAEYCNLSYLEVVRAAFVPAVISYIALIYITHIESVRLNIEAPDPVTLPRFWPTFFRGIHFLIPLGFLLYQLIIQRRSAALAAYDAIIALAVLVLVRGMVRTKAEGGALAEGLLTAAKTLGESLVAGARNMMGIGVAVSAAGIIVGVVTLGFGNVITEVIDVVSGGNLYAMLLLTAVVSLVLGMGLPTTANYIVMASLTAPAIILLSGNAGLAIPLIAAHLFVFYFGILSDDTPPVGLSAYAAAAISGADPIKTGIQGFRYDIRTALLPFMFIFNTELLLIDVQGIGQILVILGAGIIAMFSFVSFTQNFMLRKNRFYESILLLAAALILFRPDMAESALNMSRFMTRSIGVALYIGVLILQKHTPLRALSEN